MTGSAPAQPPLSGGWLGIPTLPSRYVRRPRVLDRLSAAGSCPLVLVSAPAGSGKTSLVADWVTARGDRERTAWVTFEAGDEAFWLGLARCLKRMGVELSADAFPATTGPLDRHLLASAASAVALQPADVTVVVDGYEVVSVDLAADLDFLMRHSGHRLHLVLVSRADPVLPLYRYRLDDSVGEVRMADLAFTDEEAARLLADYGVTLSRASVHALNSRTKGWVTGLRFAARILGQREDPDRAVADVAGDSGNIGEYLMGEVLAAQTPEVRRLLLRTGIPETLMPGLAEALGGRSAGRTLEFLTRENLFIDPVPERPGYYRYHPFFRDLLRAELAYESPELYDELQRTAAAWFAHEGLLALAVSHYAAVSGWGEATREVVEHLAVGELVLDGRAGPLGTALRDLPEDLDTPAACVVRAALALGDGDSARFAQELAMAGETAGDGRGEDAALDAAVILLRATEARHSRAPGEARQLAAEARAALSALDGVESRPELVALALMSEGVATVRQGRLAEGTELLTAAIDAAPDPGAGKVLVESLGLLAAIAGVGGALFRSEQLGKRAEAVARSAALGDADRAASVSTAMAWVNLEWYDLKAAHEHVRRAERSLLLPEDTVSRPLLTLVKARLQQARGDLAGALQTLDTQLEDLPVSGSWPSDLLKVEVAMLRVATDEPDLALLEVETVAGDRTAEVALVVASARLEKGDDEGAGDALSAVLAQGTPKHLKVAGWLVETARQYGGGSPGRARVALEHALRLGARERLRRPFREAPAPVQQLLQAEVQLAAEHPWLAGDPLGPTHPAPASAPAQLPVESLTQKELEVLGYLADLLTTEEIANAMFVSVNTTRTHVRSVLRKLGVSRRNAAVRRARELHLLSG